MKTKILRWIITGVIYVGVPLAASQTYAAIVTYDFGSSGQSALDLDDLESGTTTVDGITMSASASPEGAVFHRTNSGGFGINAAAFEGAPSDSTTQFDDVDGLESMTFALNAVGSLTSMSFASFGSSDEATVVIEGGSSFTIGQSDLSSGKYTFGSSEAFDWSFSNSSSLSLSFAAGNGFELESITINAISAVPEPEHYAMVSGLALVGFAAWRKRRLAKA